MRSGRLEPVNGVCSTRPRQVPIQWTPELSARGVAARRISGQQPRAPYWPARTRPRCVSAQRLVEAVADNRL